MMNYPRLVGGIYLSNFEDLQITEEMLIKFHELNQKKKEIEFEINQMKDLFHRYFDQHVGPNQKGEISINRYKLQRQIRKIEKYNDKETIKRLEELKMNDLIEIVKKPDDAKIKSAINLGLISAQDLDGCIHTSTSNAISVKQI